jgi:trk system potassium uptake protein TrkA
MYIVIAGAGIVGRSITKQLAKNHNVVVIDPNYDNCEKVSSKYGALAIQGDGTKIATLREAGIERCDVAIGVMDEDSKNLLFSLLSKYHKVKEIFVRMKDPEYREAYEQAGATNIGHSVDMMVNKFVLDIENPDIRRVASLSGGKAEICIVTLDDKTKVDGKSIMDIASQKNFPDNIVIAGLFDMENQEFIVPRGNTIIRKNYRVFLVGPSEAISNAYKYLMK